MFALPGLAALTRARRAGLFFLVVGLIYWVMIGFRYQVGMDWDNYILIQHGDYVQTDVRFSQVFTRREPGFALLSWFAANIWGGIILVNVVSATVFCAGFFLFARRCSEPFIAIAVATPLLVIAFAMSGVRQAIAIGIIFALFASWDRRSAAARVGIVLLASLFHFSAVFVLVFIALAARLRPLVKLGAFLGILILMTLAIYIDPTSVSAYSELYVAGQRKLEAPGAIAHVGVVASAALLYLTNRRHWSRVHGENPLQTQLSVAALLSVPLVVVSSVGAYRFALYLWPVAMYVWSSAPQMVARPAGKTLYRVLAVVASATMLWGWLTYANNASAWLPYKSWLLQPDDPRMLRRGRL
jgi:hypothetical protein